MSKDLNLDPQSVKLITEGLRGAIGELKGIGSSTEAVMGAGLSDLAMTGMEAGHKGLADDFEGFCENWEWGVRALIQSANTLAAKVGLSAGMMWEEEQYVEGTFKIAANSIVGNPHLTEEEVQEKSWGEVFDLGETYTPDYSAASFQKSGDDIAQTWKDTGRTLATEGRIGQMMDFSTDAAGISDEDEQRALDQMFGPSPEQRAASGEGE